MVISLSVPEEISARKTPESFPKRKNAQQPHLSSVNRMSLRTNNILFGIDNRGHLGKDPTGSSTKIGGYWKTFSNNYIFSSGLHTAGLIDPDQDGLFGDTVETNAVYDDEWREGRAASDKDNPDNRIYSSHYQKDLDEWPEEFRDLSGEPELLGQEDDVCIYTDIGGDITYNKGYFPLGLEVYQRVTLFSTDTYADIMFVHWDFKNASEYVVNEDFNGDGRIDANGQYTIKEMLVGVKTDFDIGNGDDDRAGVAPKLNLAIHWDSDFNEANFNNPVGFLGIELLDSPHDLGLTGFSIFTNRGGPREEPYTDSEAYRIYRNLPGERTEPRWDPEAELILSYYTTDMRTMLVTGPFDLPDDGSIQSVAACYLFANPLNNPPDPANITIDGELSNLAELAETARNAYDAGFTGMGLPRTPNPSLEILCNDGIVTINWEAVQVPDPQLHEIDRYILYRSYESSSEEDPMVQGEFDVLADFEPGEDQYSYTDLDVMNGDSVYYAVTTIDSVIGSLENAWKPLRVPYFFPDNLIFVTTEIDGFTLGEPINKNMVQVFPDGTPIEGPDEMFLDENGLLEGDSPQPAADNSLSLEISLIGGDPALLIRQMILTVDSVTIIPDNFDEPNFIYNDAWFQVHLRLETVEDDKIGDFTIEYRQDPWSDTVIEQAFIIEPTYQQGQLYKVTAKLWVGDWDGLVVEPVQITGSMVYEYALHGHQRTELTDYFWWNYGWQKYAYGMGVPAVGEADAMPFLTSGLNIGNLVGGHRTADIEIEWIDAGGDDLTLEVNDRSNQVKVRFSETANDTWGFLPSNNNALDFFLDHQTVEQAFDNFWVTETSGAELVATEMTLADGSTRPYSTEDGVRRNLQLVSKLNSALKPSDYDMEGRQLSDENGNVIDEMGDHVADFTGTQDFDLYVCGILVQINGITTLPSAGDVWQLRMHQCSNVNQNPYRGGTYFPGVLSYGHRRPVSGNRWNIELIPEGFSDQNKPCDFDSNGSVNIADVIAVLLFQHGVAGDPELKTDFNNDGKANVADAIALILQIRKGTCPDAMIILSSTEKNPVWLAVDKIENLSQAELEYLEQKRALLNLTPEEETAFNMALYGNLQSAELPKSFSLNQNLPNPFNPSTTITFEVPAGEPIQVKLQIYNLRGQLVKVLVNETKEQGRYSILWDGKDYRNDAVSSGIYFYRMQAGNFVQIRKMVMLK